MKPQNGLDTSRLGPQRVLIFLNNNHHTSLERWEAHVFIPRTGMNAWAPGRTPTLAYWKLVAFLLAKGFPLPDGTPAGIPEWLHGEFSKWCNYWLPSGGRYELR